MGIYWYQFYLEVVDLHPVMIVTCSLFWVFGDFGEFFSPFSYFNQGYFKCAHKTDRVVLATKVFDRRIIYKKDNFLLMGDSKDVEVKIRRRCFYSLGKSIR